MTSDQQGTYLTQEGLEKLQSELKELKNVKRKDIADRIQQAKELGDLSENAEYVEAKNEQNYIEGRILGLENMIRNAIVVQNKGTYDTVQIGSTISIESGGVLTSYSIVGSNEADPSRGKISNESPLGNAFLGKQVGESVTVDTPSGKRTYTIKAIE